MKKRLRETLNLKLETMGDRVLQGDITSAVQKLNEINGYIECIRDLNLLSNEDSDAVEKEIKRQWRII